MQERQTISRVHEHNLKAVKSYEKYFENRLKTLKADRRQIDEIQGQMDSIDKKIQSIVRIFSFAASK